MHLGLFVTAGPSVPLAGQWYLSLRHVAVLGSLASNLEAAVFLEDLEDILDARMKKSWILEVEQETEL